jgi:hypothetical protein
MIYFTTSNAALAFLKSLPTRKEFLVRAGVRENSYAEELVLNLYDEIFVYSKNLREEYLKYYKIEYPKFSEFADSFSSIPSSVLPKIDQYFQSYAFIIHFGVPGYLEEDASAETDTGAKTLCVLLNTKLAK